MGIPDHLEERKDAMELEITVEPGWGSMRELESSFEEQEGWSSAGIELVPGVRAREVEPATLVAIVGAGAVGLTALVKGLLAIAQQSAANTVVIRGRDGASLEMPADTPEEKVAYWVSVLSKIDRPRIVVQGRRKPE